ncbi:hypothetical protein EYC84_007273 [Monilinia fructicola]|uniref:Uncharacterized protein n=1 Tax=Monilinia fructicola TaxID=38448 RepID=A0A5M9KB24_MONFR|nr:hypothetical protein EYC84_007273 [Monilinia fructicola]
MKDSMLKSSVLVVELARIDAPAVSTLLKVTLSILSQPQYHNPPLPPPDYLNFNSRIAHLRSSLLIQNISTIP